MSTSIKQIKYILDNDKTDFFQRFIIFGWIRSVRSSSSTLGFAVINDGSDVDGFQIVLSGEFMGEDRITEFFKSINTGAYLNCTGKIIESPASGQKYEMQLIDFSLIGSVGEGYPLLKSKMNLDTLREYIHLRGRTNTFGSIFRIRSVATKIIHDFYHGEGFLHLDPNIITVSECEGGAGVFQVTEKDITYPQKLQMIKDGSKYDWSTDHFCNPVYLTVSSQLQLEAMACSMGNVYTMNKSFRSEHSLTSKHVSEFTHLEIEMINIDLDDLMNIAEKMIRFSITELFKRASEDVTNLDKFISKGLVERLLHLRDCEYIRRTHREVVDEINVDISRKADNTTNLTPLNYTDDLGSVHENYITKKYGCPVFVTHWPFAIKSFYMKRCDDGLKCESFDLLMPYGVGELVGASTREDNLDKLIDSMREKGVSQKGLEFYLDLRRFGTCPHGGFGLGFERLLMLLSGMANIKDVIPFPVTYKNCKY
jgi:asparaginyl-tRNA synthetase